MGHLNQPQGIEAGQTLEYRGTEDVDHEEMQVVDVDAAEDSVTVEFPGDEEQSKAPLGVFWSVFSAWEVVE